MLALENLTYKVGTKVLINNISVAFQPGKLNVIIGPNGSGKSTLLKLIADQLIPDAGTVFLSDSRLETYGKVELARIRAVLSQQTDLPFPLTVEEVVMMGRYPHFQYKPTSKDVAIANAALEKMQMSDYRERNYLTLSGGEQQRVHFARVLAQIWEAPQNNQPRYLFLDEPIASLDLAFQHEFLKITKEIAADHTVVIAIIHDLNLALQYGDFLIALKDGQKVAEGVPGEIITEQLMSQVFGVKSRVVHLADLSYPLVII